MITYELYGRAADEATLDRAAELGAGRGISSAEVALAWVSHQPAVTTPIISATQPGHIDEVVAALEVRLSADKLRTLDGPYVPCR